MLTKIHWKPSSIDIRKFGLTIIIGFGLIGGIIFWKGFETLAITLWWGAVIVGSLSIIIPALGKPFYLIWMGIAFLMGTCISTLILLIIFYGIITPIGLFMRMIGRDALKLKKKSFPSNTYWSPHPKTGPKESYERIF